MSNNKRCRGWVFTLHDYNENDVNKFKELPARYKSVGKEVCPETKRNHLQGYIYFDNAKTLSTLKKLNNKIHWEAAKGDDTDNYIYTSKEGEYFTEGVPPSQGKRTDIIETKERIVKGERVDDIIMENPIMGHQYGRTLDRVEDIVMRQKFRTEMTEGIWYWGKTGLGKSHIAYENFNPSTHYNYPNDNGWWDGYRQQDTVIINEFRGEITYKELLELVDKWPKSVKRRNREPMPFTSKKVIITSALPPEEVFKNLSKQDSLEQLYRRFEVIELTHEKVGLKLEKSDSSIFS